MKKTDVLIVGGGPAGSACAMMLADAGVSVTLLDKASFPRDKICGDALSPDVLNQLVQVRPALRAHFDLQEKKQRINGMRLVAPSGVHFDLMLNSAAEKLDGFVMSRMEFDRTLNEEVRKTKNIDLHEGVRVKKYAYRRRNACGDRSGRVEHPHAGGRGRRTFCCGQAVGWL